MSQEQPGGTRKRRQFTGIPKKIIRTIIVLFSLYLLLYISGVLHYLNVFIYPSRHNALTLLFVLSLTYLLFPATKSAPRDRLPWYDALAIVLSIVVNLYIIINCITIVERSYMLPTGMEQIFTVIIVVLLLEGVRRTTSPVLAIIGLIFFIYP